MAQYAFYAEDYPIGTTLESLGFERSSGAITNNATCTVQLSEDGVTKCFKFSADNINPINRQFRFTEEGYTVTDQEIVVIKTANSSARPNLQTHLRCPNAGDNGYRAYWYLDFVEKLFLDGTSFTQEYPGPDVPYAIRAQAIGTALKMRGWTSDSFANIATDEPATWGVETTKTSYAQGTPGVGGDEVRFIGIGTAGDPAPAAPIPSPFIQTPTGLSASNITVNSARLNWSNS